MNLETKFHLLDKPITTDLLPSTLPSPFNKTPHLLAQLASAHLQEYLKTQEDWQHNFGLGRFTEGKEIGKMFGVLAVQTNTDQIGYLAAFSGKLAGGNHHAYFVPPVYDSLAEDGFLNQGMNELSMMSKKIKLLSEKTPLDLNLIAELKLLRKNTSNGLQRKLFDSYHFRNSAGVNKTPWELYDYSENKLPPSGAGECAAPKLFQYAYTHELKPLAIAEFWWGNSTKSENQKHGVYYPACQEKCAAILKHMLG